MLTAPFIPDSTAINTGLVITNQTAAQITSAFSGLTMLPSANFSFRYRDVTIAFLKNVPAVVDAALRARLVAAGAPIA